MTDLLVLVRCHKNLDFVLDTVRSIQWSCNRRMTSVACVVDHDNRFAENLASRTRNLKVACYVTKTKYSWGVGLLDMLFESLRHFVDAKGFRHFLSIDYDTLFIDKGVDRELLSRITDEGIGMMGCRRISNGHWSTVFAREREKIEKIVGKIPPTYVPGEGVQGGAMLLTSGFVRSLDSSGLLDVRFTGQTTMADDHLLPIICKSLGFSVENVSDFMDCKWRATADPRGLEKKGVKLFHPTKLRPENKDSSIEREIRKYFEDKRNGK